VTIRPMAREDITDPHRLDEWALAPDVVSAQQPVVGHSTTPRRRADHAELARRFALASQKPLTNEERDQ